MNISLLDPFAALKDFPETLTDTIYLGYSVHVKYNLQGNYLASGLSTGTILIIDNDTKLPIRALKRHTKPIQSLTWSSCGRFLLSSSRDWKVYVWDVVKGEVVRSFNFNTPVWGAEFNPINEKEFIVALFDEKPMFIDEEGELHIIPFNSSVGNVSIPVVRFHPCGSIIFTGSNKGILSIIRKTDMNQLEVIAEMKISSSAIRNIVVSTNGAKLALNSSDRIIRQIDLPENQDEWQDKLEISHKYQDIVNRIQWNSTHISDNGEYIIASAYGSSHVIYMWETSTGSMIHILQGADEELMDLEWSLAKCTIAATGMDTGAIYLWSLVVPQKWSSLAPDFVEIDENIEYEEREDEFDYKGAGDEEADLKRMLQEEEKTVVDVWTREKWDARGNPVELGVVIPLDYELEIVSTDE